MDKKTKSINSKEAKMKQEEDERKICPLFWAAILSNPGIMSHATPDPGAYLGEHVYCIEEQCISYGRCVFMGQAKLMPVNKVVVK